MGGICSTSVRNSCIVLVGETVRRDTTLNYRWAYNIKTQYGKRDTM